MATTYLTSPMTGQPMTIDGPANPSAAAQAMILRQSATPAATSQFYQRLLTEVLPRLNRRLRPPEVLKLFAEAGIAEVAEQNGLAGWIRSFGQRHLSRGTLLGRLMNDTAFRQVV